MVHDDMPDASEVAAVDSESAQPRSGAVSSANEIGLVSVTTIGGGRGSSAQMRSRTSRAVSRSSAVLEGKSERERRLSRPGVCERTVKTASVISGRTRLKMAAASMSSDVSDESDAAAAPPAPAPAVSSAALEARAVTEPIVLPAACVVHSVSSAACCVASAFVSVASVPPSAEPTATLAAPDADDCAHCVSCCCAWLLASAACASACAWSAVESAVVACACRSAVASLSSSVSTETRMAPIWLTSCVASAVARTCASAETPPGSVSRRRIEAVETSSVYVPPLPASKASGMCATPRASVMARRAVGASLAFEPLVASSVTSMATPGAGTPAAVVSRKAATRGVPTVMLVSLEVGSSCVRSSSGVVTVASVLTVLDEPLGMVSAASSKLSIVALSVVVVRTEVRLETTSTVVLVVVRW